MARHVLAKPLLHSGFSVLRSRFHEGSLTKHAAADPTDRQLHALLHLGNLVRCRPFVFHFHEFSLRPMASAQAFFTRADTGNYFESAVAERVQISAADRNVPPLLLVTAVLAARSARGNVVLDLPGNELSV